jgi:hypothetical protein
MKSAYIFSLFLCFCACTITSVAQYSAEFRCAVQPGPSSLVTSPSTTCTPVFNTHYNNAPIINVYINVHIWRTDANETTAVMVDRVRQMIRAANENLDNMQQNWRNGPGGQPAPRVEDAKFRLKLYSETTNSLDVNGGIWVYPTHMNTWSGSIGTYAQSEQTDFPGYTRRYNNVIDVTFLNFGSFPLPLPGRPNYRSARNTAYTQLDGGNFVVAADLNGAFQADQQNGTTNPGELISRAIGRALNHEIGHILSLRHTFECGYSQCLADVDVPGECGSRCQNLQLCGETNNFELAGCDGGSNPVCRYDNSANLMAYSWVQNAITRCQWERLYQFAIGSNHTSIQDCALTNTLTLTSSPGIDYRARQLITSTSVIQVNRDVTYQAQSIILNAGFQVPQGAEFLASSSTFPCCDPPISLQSSELLSIPTQQRTEFEGGDRYKIFPVPFLDKLTIQPTQLGLNSKTDESLTLQVLDLNGRLVHSALMQSRGEITLDLSKIPIGHYFVKITGKTIQHTFRVNKVIAQ